MEKTAPRLVLALAFAFGACGGRASSLDGGRDGAAGNAASGGRGDRGGTTGSGGAVGSGGSAGGGGSSGGATGGTAGSGTAGDAGGGRGGVLGTAGVGGGPGGATGSAGAGGGGTGRGGATGAAGTGAAAMGGHAGRGGATGTAGSTGTAGAGGTSGGRCTAPGDCGGAAAGLGFCLSTTWSCVDGACIAECMGGRTCTEMPDSGCLLCRTSSSSTPMSQGCVGTACMFVAEKVSDVQRSAACDPLNTPDFATWHCTGRWASLPGSNILCTIQGVPTDAVRYSISCGSCVTVVTLGN